MKNNNKIILKGSSVSPGVVIGRVKIIRDNIDIKNVTTGDIIVAKNSHPSLAIAVMNSLGLICEKGGMLSHICIISMEMGIPCISRCHNATKVLKNNMVITLDATSGNVYVDKNIKI